MRRALAAAAALAVPAVLHLLLRVGDDSDGDMARGLLWPRRAAAAVATWAGAAGAAEAWPSAHLFPAARSALTPPRAYMVRTESGELMECWNADPANEVWMPEGAQMARDANAGGAAGGVMGVDARRKRIRRYGVQSRRAGARCGRRAVWGAPGRLNKARSGLRSAARA